jgi:ABC-type multidrug transport system fused ATPase/permease subunit
MDVAASKEGITEKAGEALIEFEKVCLRYHEGADEAISDISFKIEEGSTFGIIGGTGSGKSSVASLIPRFYDATGGSIKIFGQDIKKTDIDELRRYIGIVMQKSVLFEGTIRDNLKWGNCDATDEELLEAADAAVCREVIEQKGGLDAKVESGGRNFSGGQRQRLSIARVLAGKYPVIILDDSSSALDYMTDKKLRQNIRNLKHHPTVIIISQRAISVSDCDSILVLDDGRCVGLGTSDELLADCEVYKEIYYANNPKEGS